MVRAKFRCDKKEASCDGFQIRMSAVVYGSPENEEFFKWTPGGQLTLGTINEKAAAELIEGQEYYLDISPAPASK